MEKLRFLFLAFCTPGVLVVKFLPGVVSVWNFFPWILHFSGASSWHLISLHSHLLSSKMTTGSALPLIGETGAGNWQSSKDLGSHDPLSTSLSGEELACMSNGGSIYGSLRDAALNRCGSAPPSMEGSLAELDHLIGQHSGNLEATLRSLSCGADSSKSEERLSSDPAYFKYSGSKVNLNPRLPAPRVSRENRHLMNRFSKAGEWRPFSLDDSSNGISLTHCSTLSTHKEEPEDDRSPRLDLSSAEDARCDSGQSTSKIGSHSSNLVGLMQVSCPCINSLSTCSLLLLFPWFL